MKAEVAAITRQADEGKRSDQIQPVYAHLFCHRKLKQLDLHGTLARQMLVVVFTAKAPSQGRITRRPLFCDIRTLFVELFVGEEEEGVGMNSSGVHALQ